MHIEYVAALAPVVVDPDGDHWLEGFRCRKCRIVVPERRTACPACGHREALGSLRLGLRGQVHTWTSVHRSYGNAKTPFICVVVDLQGGGSLKGTLIDYEGDPLLRSGFPVRVVFRDTGQRDAQGRAFLCYFFSPDHEATS